MPSGNASPDGVSSQNASRSPRHFRNHGAIWTSAPTIALAEAAPDVNETRSYKIKSQESCGFSESRSHGRRKRSFLMRSLTGFCA
jgi:hypothetical protein